MKADKVTREFSSGDFRRPPCKIMGRLCETSLMERNYHRYIILIIENLLI